jgi:hypothetical protein
VTFSVEKSWRGQPGEQIEIRSSRRVDCRQEFAVGERYLVYADRRSEDGRGFTTCCHRGSTIEERLLAPEVVAGIAAGEDVLDGATLEMEELDRLVASAQANASAADEEEIRALWDGYLAASQRGAAEDAAARHCPEMFALMERWKDLALYAPQDTILRLHIQEMMIVLGLRHRIGIGLRELSGKELLERSYRERWHGWVEVFDDPLAVVRVDRPQARGYRDTGRDVMQVGIRFRHAGERWCYDKAASIVNTFEQPDRMRIAIDQLGSSQNKSFLEMIQQSIPGDAGRPVQTDATIWQPLLSRP